MIFSKLFKAISIGLLSAWLISPAIALPYQYFINGIQSWTFQSSTVDDDFTKNRCSINRIAVNCSQVLSNTNSTGGYVTWADGHVSSIPANTLRFSDLGLTIEMQDTNIALWSNDLTQAGTWTLSNITVTKNQIGPDLIANSASLLTASMNNGTALQSITSSSSTRFLSVYIKRVTGSGTISITQDNSSYTDVTAQLNTSTYTRVGFVQAGLTNPTVGLKIGTSGDQIAVWCVDEETSANNFMTSPIITTTTSVTRSSDQVSVVNTTMQTLIQQAHAIYGQSFKLPTNGWSGTYFDFTGGAIGQFNNSATSVIISNNTNNVSTSVGSGNSGGIVKVSFGMDTNSFTIIANNGTQGVSAHAWAGNTGTVYLGFKNAGGNINWMNGYLQRFAVGPVKGMFDGKTT